MRDRLILFFALIFFGTNAIAQDDLVKTKNVYTTTSGEIIFSWADITKDGNEESSIMRFSPVINIQNWVNIDRSENFGWFTGLSLRNVGFIYNESESVKKKYRTYNIGIPLGIKLGNLNGKFLFAGYELEFPIHYKEKTFEDEDKTDKKTIWFSDRVNVINHSVMAGIQLPYGATIKFKYYFTNFFNENFEASNPDVPGEMYKPFKDFNVNIFYVSLNFGLLKNANFYYNDK